MIFLSSMLDWLALRLATATLLIAMMPAVLALAILPWTGIPQPRVPDEFSYLLAADTFASGRLANPPHPHWRFFEALHVIQQPTYASKYPPGQGLAMALGQALLGHPWFGVAGSFAAMCAATHWMLRGWLPARWALLGALLFLAKYPVFHYWIQSYWGGAVAAVGGSLLLGALPRLRRGGGVVIGLAAAAGMSVLLLSRPFEGIACAIPIMITACKHGRRIALAAAAAGVVAAAGWMAFYNYRVTGDPLLLPYVLHERTYSSVPSFYLEQPAPPTGLGNEALRRADTELVGGYRKLLTLRGFAWKTYMATELPRRREDVSHLVRSLFAASLFASLPFVFRDRRMRVPLWCLGCTAAALLLVIYYADHYAAPAAGLKILLITQGVRHAAARWRLHWAGSAIAAGCLTFLVAMTAAYGWARGTGIRQDRGFAAERPGVIRQILHDGGRHLVFVRYGRTHDVSLEWVRNAAGIDASAIVWAHDLGAEANRALVRYFPGRRVWLLKPDVPFARAIPYPGP